MRLREPSISARSVDSMRVAPCTGEASSPETNIRVDVILGDRATKIVGIGCLRANMATVAIHDQTFTHCNDHVMTNPQPSTV